MTNEWANIIIAVIGGGYLLGLAALITAIAGRKKAKADALSSVEGIIKAQLERADAEAEKWQHECSGLRAELEIVKGRVDENDACQTTLKGQIAMLEREKRDLTVRIGELEDKLKELQNENRRLRTEQENAKGVIS